MGGRPGRVLRVDDRPGQGRAPGHARPALGAARGHRRGGRHHARGTSPIRSTWPSWARPWPPATPSSSSRPPTRRGAPRCSAGSSPRRPTSPPVSSTSSRRRTPPSGRASSTDPRVDQVSFTGSTATGRTVMAAGGRHAQAGLPRARRQVGVRRARRRRPARRLRRGRLHRVRPRRPGLRHHHPPASCPRAQFDEAVDVTAAALRQAAGRRPHRPRHHLRAAHQRPPARPGGGLHRPGPRRGRGRSWPAGAGPTGATRGSSWSRR